MLRSFLSVEACVALYKSETRPFLEYTDVVWIGLSPILANRLEGFSYTFVGEFWRTRHSRLPTTLNCHTFSSCRSYHLALLWYKISHHLVPKQL